MNKYPLLLKPVPKEIIWGGSRLKEKYNKEASFDKIAESWELTCRQDSMSVISNGEYKGMKIVDYFEGKYTTSNFPLLIKFIDASDKLSVQVHPGDDVTDDNGISLGKTEMWYVIDAEPNSQLVYGIKPNVSKESFIESVNNSDTESCLNYINVNKGDVYFIPAGLVHAIGKGILIAEIQQNSDTTYRLYDYNRTDKNGNQRELHIKEAINSIKLYNNSEINSIRYSKGRNANIVASCDKFTVERLQIEKEYIFPSYNKFISIICIEGCGKISYNDVDYPIESGQTYLIPENSNSFAIFGNLELLTATI